MADYHMIPDHCRESMQNYIERGVPVGDFLRNVIENNLVKAISYADDVNRPRLRDYALFLCNEAPRGPVPSWGSEQAYAEWVEIGGLFGLRAGRLPERLADNAA